MNAREPADSIIRRTRFWIAPRISLGLLALPALWISLGLAISEVIADDQFSASRPNRVIASHDVKDRDGFESDRVIPSVEISSPMEAGFELASSPTSKPVATKESSSETGSLSAATRSSIDLANLCRAFEGYSGARLVFVRDDLPEGRYHDILKPLHESRRANAAEICLQEAKMYPPGYFAEVGLKVIGVFAACVSNASSDRGRPYDAQLGGYRYFGVYNGKNAVAASFYSEGQLALTFHHEVFHHVDSTVGGETDKWQLSSDDAFYQAAITGMRPYRSPTVASEDLEALRRACIGFTLKDSVSEYASKNYREDQAETARHMLSMLPNALVQVIDQPHLPGSQRILHILQEYEQSVVDGPDFDWFVDVALQRADSTHDQTNTDTLLASLRVYTQDQQAAIPALINGGRGARALLRSFLRMDPSTLSPEQSADLVQRCGLLTQRLLLDRLRPDPQQQQFDIWGSEDAQGVNHTLRHDVAQIAKDSQRLRWISDAHGTVADHELVGSILLKRIRLLARYSRFIQEHWVMTSGTKAVFEDAKLKILNALPDDQSALANRLRDVPIDAFAGDAAVVLTPD